MNLLRFKVLVEWDPEGQVWVTYVPDLNWLSTYGDTREEAMERTREAILGYLGAAEKEGLPLPAPQHGPELVEIEVTAP
ncbi:MAG: type II toxin-antitoxin system HicB family antitoxin [Hydrogenibacillus schlegelii]|nr:type II toxin-antitoxin system HicB family antitoxin [Hydrogenibacillus schlegelii]